MLKILHTSDLHLGKKLFKVDRLSEQKQYLDWLIKTCKEQDIDVLIIAGDIFDTPSPPHEAVSLYFSFLDEISEKTNTLTLIIAGNHDSSIFIQAPDRILEKRNIMVWGELNDDPTKHHYTITKNNTKYRFYLLPYFRGYDFLSWHQFYLNKELPKDHLEKEKDFIDTLKLFLESESREKDVKKIFIGHHLFGPFSLSGSEQVISLSGLDSIPMNLFEDFDYMALGHIHKYQKVSTKINAFYSGSPYPLRFSETETKKVNIINIQEKKDIEIEALPVPQSRKLYQLKTTKLDYEQEIKELIKNEDSLGQKNLLSVEVILDEPTTGIADQIREILTGSNTDLLILKTNYLNTEETSTKQENIKELSLNELFEDYYQSKYETNEVPQQILSEFKELIESRNDS